jgi:hypothetical protein
MAGEEGEAPDHFQDLPLQEVEVQAGSQSQDPPLPRVAEAQVKEGGRALAQKEAQSPHAPEAEDEGMGLVKGVLVGPGEAVGGQVPVAPAPALQARSLRR